MKKIRLELFITKLFERRRAYTALKLKYEIQKLSVAFCNHFKDIFFIENGEGKKACFRIFT